MGAAPPRGATLTHETRAWLAALEARPPRHARILRALVDAGERDDRVRTVMVGCSIGRGVADELSDIDAHVMVADDAWPAVVDDVERVANAAGEPMEVLVHRLDGVSRDTHRHVFVQYCDGVQLSLVVQPLAAQTRRGRAADVVVLHDPDDHLGVVVEPSSSRLSPRRCCDG